MDTTRWIATSRPPAPQRRRAIVIGAGPTGISLAFHLGEHCLLLDRRESLENTHDHSNDFPMGSSRSDPVGCEGTAADGQRPGVSGAERKALIISCTSQGQGDAGDHTLIHIARWKPPEFNPAPRAEAAPALAPSAHALVPLLRGELRLGSLVVRISPTQRLVELANGVRFVFDKLVSTLSLSTMARLVMQELPGRVRHDESVRYWLSDHDIELADRATQQYYGDLDEFAAGKRVAQQIGEALDLKFRNAGRPSSRGAKLFEPRLVMS